MNEKEWDGLKTTINNLKEQLTMERRKKYDMEKELSIVLADNQNLEVKLQQLEQEQSRIGALENELQVVEIESGKICKLCGVKLNQDIKQEESVDLDIEHDDLDTTGLPNGQLIRLKKGGSAFGSRESLNMMGLEAEDDSPTISSRDFHDFDSLITPSRAPTGSVKASDSLLGELEEQYKRLVYKYESLIEAKAKRDQELGGQEEEEVEEEAATGGRPASLSISKEVQTINRRSLIFKSPIDPCDAHFEHGPPEYKMLFKEIFDTLRKSVVFEDELMNKSKMS